MSITVALGTSMPTSMTVVATSTSAPPGGEREHRRLLVLGAHLAVQQRHAVVAQLAAAQALVLGRRRARLQRLGLLHQRAHDERLAPGVELLADEVVGARALGVGRRDVRLDRLAAARQLAQRGDVEVAVAQQRHRARDRRRGHVQDVRHRARPAPWRPAPRAGARRSGAARRRRRPPAGRTPRRARPARASPRRTTARPEASLFNVSVRRDAVVEPVSSAARTASPGISACSVAKCCSASVSVGAMKTACMSCSTARSIACSATTVLPEPTSPMSRRCIGRGEASSSSSVAIARAWSPVSANGSSSSRQRRVSDGAPSSTGAAPRRAPLRAAAQQRELGEQQLVEGQPAPAALVVAGVGGDERGRAVREPAARPRPRRQRLDRVLGGRQVGAHQREDLRRGQPLRRRVVGDLAAAAGRLVGRRVARDAKGVARGVLAVQDQARARRVLARQPRLVEERRLHDAGLVGDGRLDERLHPAPAHRAARDRAHLDDDRRDVAGLQRPDRARRAAVARQVLEQVADRQQAELLGGVGGLLRRDLQRRGERRGARPAQRRGEQRRVVELLRIGEGGGHPPMMIAAADRSGYPPSWASPSASSPTAKSANGPSVAGAAIALALADLRDVQLGGDVAAGDPADGGLAGLRHDEVHVEARAAQHVVLRPDPGPGGELRHRADDRAPRLRPDLVRQADGAGDAERAHEPEQRVRVAQDAPDVRAGRHVADLRPRPAAPCRPRRARSPSATARCRTARACGSARCGPSPPSARGGGAPRRAACSRSSRG